MKNRISNYYTEPTDVSQLLRKAVVDRDFVMAMHRILGELSPDLIIIMTGANTVLAKVHPKRQDDKPT